MNVKTGLVHFEDNANADNYMENVINGHVVPVFAGRPDLIFMHDNARPLVANATRNHIRKLGIRVLPWPAKYPDLNTIWHQSVG